MNIKSSYYLNEISNGRKLSKKDIVDYSYSDIKNDVEVIVPALNEEFTIGYIIEKLQLLADKIIVIDGGSKDNTLNVAKKYDIKIMIQNGRGKGAALREAFEETNKDYVIMIDADGSMDPEEIPRYIEALHSGADVVKGSRFLKTGGSDDMSLFRKFGNFVFVKLVNLFFGVGLTDLCYGYIAFNKSSLSKISKDLYSNHFDIETEIILKAIKLGLKVVEVPSYEFRRIYGKSNLNSFKDGYKILKVIIKEMLH